MEIRTVSCFLLGFYNMISRMEPECFERGLGLIRDCTSQDSAIEELESLAVLCELINDEYRDYRASTSPAAAVRIFAA